MRDFYPFSIKGVDLVLGIKWLASLNTVHANWNEMFLIFKLNGKIYRLQRYQKLQSLLFSLNTLLGHENLTSIPSFLTDFAE